MDIGVVTWGQRQWCMTGELMTAMEEKWQW